MKVFAVKGKHSMKTEPKLLLTLGTWEVYDERHGLHVAHKPKEGIGTYTLYIPWGKLRAALKRRERRRITGREKK